MFLLHWHDIQNQASTQNIWIPWQARYDGGVRVVIHGTVQVGSLVATDLSSSPYPSFRTCSGIQMFESLWLVEKVPDGDNKHLDTLASKV